MHMTNVYTICFKLCPIAMLNFLNGIDLFYFSLKFNFILFSLANKAFKIMYYTIPLPLKIVDLTPYIRVKEK